MNTEIIEATALHRSENNIMNKEKGINDLKQEAMHLSSYTLNDRQICDLELIMNGGFSPLTGFLNKSDYESVCSKMRLSNGNLWPLPITLEITEKLVDSLKENRLVLRDKEGFALAILDIEDIWYPNRMAEAESVFGTRDLLHPGVNYLLNQSNFVYVGGELRKLSPPHHYDFKNLRHTPKELKSQFQKLGWDMVVAFQTRNPLHKAHFEMIMRASKEYGANILIHPVVGLTKPGDVNHYTRVRCYQKILDKFPVDTAMLSLIPLAMRMGGPREALWHAIIRKNYGCTHFIVGRDHAGPGADSDGIPFYGPYDAQKLVENHSDEIGIKLIPFKKMVYNEKNTKFYSIDEIPEGMETFDISGSELRRRLDKGSHIPEWFSFPEVISELRKSIPPLINRGFTVFFTGLSGSGKSTLAKALMVKLLEDGRRPVTLLDGDIVRTHLSNELGFSKEHRSINVQRIGFVASEITKNGGIAICAPIAPYSKDRKVNQRLINQFGGYIEVYVSTPMEVCEERDVKGLYAKARLGLIKEFTGIDDPYEKPKNPALTIDSSATAPEKLAQKIILKIEQLEYM